MIRVSCRIVFPLGTVGSGMGGGGRNALVSCPARARLPARNGLVNEVKFLGLITQNR